MARDHARLKAYWKQVKLARKLSAENLTVHNQLQETGTVASPQAPVVSQPENSGCLDPTSAVSQSYRHLTIEGKTALFQLNLNKLSLKGGVEQSSILVENCEDSEVVCVRCVKRGSQIELVFSKGQTGFVIACFFYVIFSQKVESFFFPYVFHFCTKLH